MGLHQRQIGLKSVENIDWSGKKVLDIGCSDGKLSLKIIKKTNIKNLDAIDPNNDYIQKAIETAKSKNFNNISFHVANADNLKIFSDNSFDAIFCNMAFQQFKNPQKALDEIFRVLKKNGVAIINFNVEKSPIWIQKLVIYNKYFGNPNEKIVIAKRINEQNFSDMAKRAGFSQINTTIKNDVYYYKSFKETIDPMDGAPFSEYKQLTEEQQITLNKKLEKYLESTRTPNGIPENWKILFGELII